MTIIFEPQYAIGDTVYLKIEPEKKYVIDGYRIFQINENDEVSFYQYEVYDAAGNVFFYTEQNIQLVESLK